MDRPGTCIILDKKYNIANSSCQSWGPYNIFLVTDRSIYCHMTLSAMNYLLYIPISTNTSREGWNFENVLAVNGIIDIGSILVVTLFKNPSISTNSNIF